MNHGKKLMLNLTLIFFVIGDFLSYINIVYQFVLFLSQHIQDVLFDTFSNILTESLCVLNPIFSLAYFPKVF